jgi:hypothetical protein
MPALSQGDPVTCKGVVSTTFDFQRTGVEIIPLLVTKLIDFGNYQQQTAEDGLSQRRS